jgi:hypothetical protein
VKRKPQALARVVLILALAALLLLSCDDFVFSARLDGGGGQVP